MPKKNFAAKPKLAEREKGEPKSLPNERRGRPAISKSQETPGFDPVAEQYERPRETVKVDFLPDPPDVKSATPSPQRNQPLNLEETVVNILKEEMEELSVRLEKFGVRLDPRMQQDMVDIGISLLGGVATSGGAIRSR